MEYSFNVEIAGKYGVEAAILVNNFDFWLSKNKANERNIIDGRAWTYNSAKALERLFPFWNQKKIYRLLNKMIEYGIIQSGVFNNVKYDQTKWYRLTDQFIKDNSSLQVADLEFPKMGNRNSETGKPIPDNKPDNKPDSKEKNNKKRSNIPFVFEKQGYSPLLECAFWYNTEFQAALRDWDKVRKRHKCSDSFRAWKAILKKLSGLTEQEAIKIVDKASQGGWRFIFVDNNKSNGKSVNSVNDVAEKYRCLES